LRAADARESQGGGSDHKSKTGRKTKSKIKTRAFHWGASIGTAFWGVNKQRICSKPFV
jgi:hypothetical protein